MPYPKEKINPSKSHKSQKSGKNKQNETHIDFALLVENMKKMVRREKSRVCSYGQGMGEDRGLMRKLEAVAS